MKRRRPRADEDRRNQRKKRAPAGPAKHDARKLPERPPMIAAVGRRIGARLRRASATLLKWSRRVDRAADRALERAHPALRRGGRRLRAAVAAVAAWVG